MGLEIGQVIEGKYKIDRLLGEGGMGAVYGGENIRIHRKVAIKVLHAAFTENQEVVQRFEREAQAAGHIGNDHIMEVLDLGTLPDGDLFLVMEFLEGEALSDRAHSRGRISPNEMASLMIQVLEGLAAAHNSGIIHRDLKPDNIFILNEKAGQKDFVKIIDFGISKFQPMSGGDGMKMTKTGTMMGTPYYMSPEQATGKSEADARSDIYALGVIMYECVAGQVPFDAPSFNQLLFKIALSTPPPIEEVVADIDPAFASIIAKSMAREPEDRFQTSDEFRAALENWTDHRAAVSVPPPDTEAEAKEKALESDSVIRVDRYGAEAEAIAATGKPATTGSWSTSQIDAPARSPGMMVAAAAVALLVVGGGGFMAYQSMSSSEAAAAAAAAAEERAKKAEEARTATMKEAESAKVEAERKAAEAKVEAEKRVEEEKAAAEKRIAAQKAAMEEKAQEEKKKVRVQRVVKRVVVPMPAPHAAPPPAPRPTPKPAPKPAGGGVPDFGY